MKFDWDENKNRLNRNKHGIDFQEAVTVFSDHFALSIPDNEHSDEEKCWILLGKNLNDKLLLVVHTFRCGNVTRIISARKATRSEQAHYINRLVK